VCVESSRVVADALALLLAPLAPSGEGCHVARSVWSLALSAESRCVSVCALSACLCALRGR
jgi:hypothetical protein